MNTEHTNHGEAGASAANEFVAELRATEAAKGDVAAFHARWQECRDATAGGLLANVGEAAAVAWLEAFTETLDAESTETEAAIAKMDAEAAALMGLAAGTKLAVDAKTAAFEHVQRRDRCVPHRGDCRLYGRVCRSYAGRAGVVRRRRAGSRM
jgi:hypothetical protein